MKRIKNIAILPIAKEDGNWNGAEYLGLYPIIKKSHNPLTGFMYFIDNPNEIGIQSLQQWLNPNMEYRDGQYILPQKLFY